MKFSMTSRNKEKYLLKINFWLVVLGLLLWPGLVLAQSPKSYILLAQAKLSDLELSQMSGQGIDKPQPFRESNAGRIILWDEWQRAQQNVPSGSGSGVNLILTGPRP
jgi:hypothetical protein